jgi:hypothetical protein
MAGRDFSAELFGPSAGRDFSAELFGAKPPEKQSAFRQIADVPLGIAKGAVQGVRMIADAFGAGSDTSNTIKSAETYLADLMSAQAKNDQQEISRIMKDAEDKGVLDQVKAGIKAFTVAPVDTLSSALGTAAPVIAGALGAKILGAGALVSTGVSALTGAGMGAGVVKGSIYEETKRTLKEAGASEQDAEARAKLAQEYGGKNLDQILLGTVLGGAAAVGPLEKGAAGILARRILGKTGTEGAETIAEQSAKGAARRRLEASALEAVPEMVQAGQEQVAQNIALQREGFDVPTFRGAVSAATLEGLAGAGLGAALGGGKPTPEAPAPEAPPVAAPPVAPEVEPEKPMITRVMDMAAQQNGYGLLEQQKQRLLAESQTEDIKKELTFIQEIQDRMNIETAQRLTPSGKSPFTITPDTLTELGIKPTSPIIKRINGKAYDDPYVIEQLEKFAANKNVAPEVQQSVLAFVKQIRQPVEPPATPPVEAPVAPPVEPAAEAPAAPVAEAPVEPAAAPPVAPVAEAAVEPSVAEDSELVTPAPVVEAAAPVVEEPAAPAESDKKALEEKRQMIADMIETKKANREAVPEAWVKKLADVTAQLRGETIEEDVTYSMEVPGNPLFDGPPVLRNLVPIKVKDSAAAQRALDRALDLEKEVATEFYSARQALSVAKTAAQKKAAQARVKKLNDQGWDEDALKTLRTETIGELSRLVDVTQKAPAAPTVETAAPKAEAPPTLDTSDIKEVKGRHPQVQAAAKLLQDKKISKEEFEKYVDYYKPIQEVESEKLLPPTSEQKMNETVNADKRDRINVPVEDGTKVGLRMDLPARERGGSVVSIHEGKSGKLTVGKLMGFRSTGWLKDVTFEVRSQEKGLAVATGAAKAPQQTVEGTWQNLGPEETYARVKELMKDPAWKQIGFDPSRHGYFYDRKTREPVVSASEMYQVGQFLLAKDVKYAPKENYLYSIEPTIKSDRVPSYKRGVENLRKRWEKGDLTSDEFAGRVDILAKQVENAELSKELSPRERGADYIRQRLLEAKRRGELTAEAVDFAEWFILQNPKLVDDLAISIRTPKEGGVAGSYESVRRLMTLMKDNSSDYTAVHEILHHLERMMPKDVQSAIRKVWLKSLVEAQKKAKTEAEKTFFKNIMEYHFGMGGNVYLKNALDAIKNGNIDKSFYQYSSPSEFWAENGSEIMGNRFLMQGSVLKKLKQWLREFVEKAKDLFGLNSKAPIIRALDSLSKGDGKFVTSTLLDETTEPKFSITGKATAAAQKALQKQPMPEKGLGHVSKDLTNLAQPIFFPQNKTILDRIDSMKDRFWQRLAQGTADQFRTIKEYSPVGYIQARLSKSIDGSLEGLLFHGQVFDDGGALNIKKNTKGMMEILKPIGNELDSYLMWVALNRESRLPDEKRSKIPNMEKLVARRAEFAAGELNGKPRVEVYQDILKQMNQLNKSVLDIALKKGLIDQEGYDNFSNDIYYIPFYKKMEEDGTVEGAKTASGLTSQDFSKELKGSEAPFGDLMENIVRNWSHILSASMKNAAAQTTLNDAMELQAAEPNLKAGLEMRDGVVYSTKNDKPIAAKFDEDGKQLYAEGVLRPDLTTGGAGMAKIMVDGQPMYFKVTDELLMESISSIGYMGPKSKFLDVMRDFKNMLQFGVTASPIFKVNNLIRDSVSAMAVSDLKKSPVHNVMKGISLSNPDSPTYISALAGGAIFNFGSAYEGDQATLIKRLLDQGVDSETILDSPDKIKKALKKTWDAYQELGNRSEAANRLSLYQQMRDKGMSHLEASFMARDLLDFSMQGSWGTFRFLTQVVPFMNARIQGLYKLGRDGINPTVRVLYNATTGKEIDANDKIRAAQFSIVTVAVAAASALLYLTFKDDEDYKKRDAWDRDNFWWFKIPSLDIAFRIPKPFEVGAFGTLVERTLEQILDEGAEGKQFGESLNRTLWDTFALNPMPQIFKPLSDIYANKDSFSGAPIESAGLERLSKPERMTDMTSPLGIALSRLWSSIMPEKFEASPVQMDYAIKGYFGWLGAMASLTSTYAVMPFKEGEYPDARWLDRASLGLVRDLPAPQSAYVTSFYNASKEISQAYADMRHYREMGDAEKVQEILEEKGDKIALAKFYDKTAKNIANVRKQIRLITNDKDMDGAEKKEAIERMKLIMSDLAKQAEEVRKSMKQ